MKSHRFLNFPGYILLLILVPAHQTVVLPKSLFILLIPLLLFNSSGLLLHLISCGLEESGLTLKRRVGEFHLEFVESLCDILEQVPVRGVEGCDGCWTRRRNCLLYTSDAADD